MVKRPTSSSTLRKQGLLVFLIVCFCVYPLVKDNVHIHVYVEFSKEGLADGGETSTDPRYHDRSSDNSSSFQFHPDKRSLVLHIGPSKTGTTSIQMESRDMPEALKRDNYIYVGRYAGVINRAVRPLLSNDDCLYRVSDYLLQEDEDSDNLERRGTDIPCWRDKLAKVNRVQNNTSIIWSDEAFSYGNGISRNETHLAALRVAFRDWNFLVVPTYRRYAEWTVSVTKEMQSKACLDENHKGAHWPDLGGCPCGQIWDKVDNFRRRDNHGGAFYHNIDFTVPRFKAAGIPLSMLNFHSKRGITSSFYCDIIKDAKHTCEHTLNRKKTSVHNSKSVLTAACSNILFGAAMKNLSGVDVNETTRYQAAVALEHRLKASGHKYADLPLLCPSQPLLEHLLNKSLKFEETMVPNLYASPEGEAEHRRSFWQLANDRKEFCDVDYDRLFENARSLDQILSRLNMTFLPQIYRNTGRRHEVKFPFLAR